jgi:proline iminopeptidase
MKIPQKPTAFFLFILLIAMLSCSDEPIIYSKAFGDKKDPAIIFLHGGPGYNSASFELSTAGALAEKGYYVIVYDNRGSGRSENVEGKYTFDEIIQDLDDIYKKYDIKKATLLGHSFGGAVGIKYALRHPAKVEHLVLVDAPVNYPHTFETIIERCGKYYTEKEMPDIMYIAMLKQMDPSSLEYAIYSFMHAMSCGLYKPSKPGSESREITERLKASPDAEYLSMMTEEPVKGFHANERYTTMDLSDDLKKAKMTCPVSAIYGEDDGLFDDRHFGLIKSNVGDDRFFLLKNASHSVFIDQQSEFIKTVENIVSGRLMTGQPEK